MRYALLSLMLLFSGCSYFSPPMSAEEVPPPLPYINRTPKELDGHGRYISWRLNDLARQQAEKNATHRVNGHTDLDALTHEFGVLAENVCIAGSWEHAYNIWRKSDRHNANMNGPFRYMGYAEVRGVEGNYYVVIYSSRGP